MGDYIDNAYMIDRLGTARATQLSAESGTEPDTDQIDDVIGEAEGVVNGYLANRVDVPVDETQYPKTFAALKGLTYAIAQFILAGRRPPVPDDWKIAYNEAIAYLKGVAEGKIGLPDDTLTGKQGEWGSSDPNASREALL
ncbi:hypothetical protein AMJ85_05300 [candidate division BRC1 bacterium SM23_51]|nr:MAG: hypothetical protein AMJ85_05300 [candidate division BRC1 bacterium SM23_51]